MRLPDAARVAFYHRTFFNGSMGMLDDSMKPTGSDVETAKLLAKDWGLELEFVQTTGAPRIPNLQTNKADIVISTLGGMPGLELM